MRISVNNNKKCATKNSTQTLLKWKCKSKRNCIMKTIQVKFNEKLWKKCNGNRKRIIVEFSLKIKNNNLSNSLYERFYKCAIF